MSSYTIKKLKETDSLVLIQEILQDRKWKLTNIYSPFSQRLAGLIILVQLLSTDNTLRKLVNFYFKNIDRETVQGYNENISVSIMTDLKSELSRNL